MPAIQIGNLTANYQPDGDNVHQGPDGSGEAVLVYKLTSIGFSLSSLPAPLSPHPVYSQLLLYEANAAREPGNIMAVTCTYRGVIVGNMLTYSQQEFNVNTSADPIETHPRYALPVDSPPVTAAEMAQINIHLEQNLVYALNAPVTATLRGVELWKKKQRGIDSYLNIGGVYRLSYIQSGIPTDYSAIGTIFIAPTLSPVAPNGRNYLFTALNWRKQGGVVSVSEEYTMSGLAGWDIDLYETTPPPP